MQCEHAIVDVAARRELARQRALRLRLAELRAELERIECGRMGNPIHPSRGRVIVDGDAPKPFLNVPGLLSFVWADGPTANPPVFGFGYTGTSTAPLVKSAPNMTLTDGGSSGGFSTAELQGTLIKVGPGATTPANDGTFDMVSAPTGFSLRYVNNAGVAEAYLGPYQLYGRFLYLADYVNTSVYPWASPTGAAAIQGFAKVPNLVAGKNVLGAAGNFAYALSDQYGQFGAPFAGDVDMSVSIRLYVTGYGKQLFTIDDGSDPPSGAVDRIQFILTTSTATTMARKNSGGTTTMTFTGTGMSTATWITVGWRYVASTRVMSFYRDGALIGSAAAGAARNLPGLSRAILGNYTANAAGTWTRGYAFANAAWSDADFAAVHAKFLALSA